MTSKEAYKSAPVLHNGHTPETAPQREEWNSGLPLCILLSSSLSSPFQWPWKLYPRPGHSLRRSIRHTGIPAHNHNSHQHIFPGVQQNTANHGHQVHVEEDSSIAVLVCQVVKVPAGSPVPQPAPTVPATPPNSCRLTLYPSVFTRDSVRLNHPRQDCHG
ncbi:hypothetical protein MRX96_016365 [Rhipicephalus microplus]